MLLLIAAAHRASAQAEELQQLALNIEKLAQFKQILSDLKKGYEILSRGYGTVRDIAEGNYKLHQAFLDGLYMVSPEVRRYRRVGQIIDYQLVLVGEQRAAARDFSRSDLFSPSEMGYMASVHQRLIAASLNNLEELTLVLTAGQLRMSDDERLQAIDRIHADMEELVMFLRHFNNQSSVLSLQRQRARSEIGLSRELQGIKK